MPSAERTIMINRPVEQVFAFFSDPANDLKWRPDVKEISAQGAIGQGSFVHQVVNGPAGRGISADYEVTEYDMPSRFAFRVVAGPVRPTGLFRFRETENGTEVTFSLDATLAGVKKLLMSKPVETSMKSEMAALDRAKAVLERM